MASLGTAYIKIAPDLTGVQGKISRGFSGAGTAAANKVGSEMNSGLSKVASAAGTVLKTGIIAASVAIGAALVANIGGAVRRIDTLNNSARTFENMGFDAGVAQAAMKNLDKSIKGLPTSLDDGVRGMTALAATYGDINKGQKIFSALNNAILGFGGSSDMVNNAITQLSQLPMDGPLDAQTWNSLRNSGLTPVLVAMGKDMGLSVSQLKEKLGNGELTVKDFTDSLIKLNTEGGGGLKSLEKIAQDSTKGISTGYANMKTSIVRGVAEVLKAIGPANISGAIGSVGKIFESSLKSIANAVPPTVAALSDIGKQVASYIGPKLAELGKVITKDLIPAIVKTVAAFQPMISAVGSGLVVALGAAINITKTMVQIISGALNVIRVFAPAVTALVAGFVAYKVAIIAINTVQKLQALYAAATGASYVILNGSLVAVKGSTIAATAAQVALNVAMSLNPIGLLVAGIAVLGVALFGLKNKTDANKRSVDSLSEAQRMARAANQLAAESTDRLKEAQNRAEGANIAVEYAQRNLTAAISQYGPESLEARDAALQLKRAEEEQTDARRDNTIELGKNIDAKNLQKQKTAEAAAEESGLGGSVRDTTSDVKYQYGQLDILNSKLGGLNGKTVGYNVIGHFTSFEEKKAATGSGVPFRSAGGPVSARKPYIVGENRDGSINSTSELFVPSTAGRIVNSRDLQSALAGGGSGGGTEYNIGTINISNEVDGERWLRKLTGNQEITSARLTPKQAYM